MSAGKARAIIDAVLDKLIKDVLVDQGRREKLDRKIHVLDLSYNHLIRANGLKDSPSVQEAYDEFMFHVIGSSTPVTSLKEAIDTTIGSRFRNYLFVETADLLVCKNFKAARIFITEISKLIPNNLHFGTSYRERTLSELQEAYGIEDDSTIGILKDKAFLLEDGFIHQVVEKAPVTNNAKPTFVLERQVSLGKYFFVAFAETSDSEEYKVEPFGKHIGSQVSNENTEIVFVQTNYGKVPLLKRKYLSKLDLGHLFKKNTFGGETPLGTRLQDALVFEGLSAANKRIVQDAVDDLDKQHGQVDYIWYNAAADGSSTEINKKVGVVFLTVQYYRENNRLAREEARIKKEILDKFSKLAYVDIPGSNTIVQDLLQKATNMLVTALGGKAKPLDKHKPVSGTVKIKDNTPINIGYGKVSGPSKRKQSASKSKPLKIVEPKQFNLTNLQNLINRQLQDVIIANMGDGDRRNILNYRTGRLAASAKVERMSESRVGMITAFYSYMKNPYATFSEGGQQSIPKTRDPKLLISKSIREIAAQQVGNRLRAVNI